MSGASARLYNKNKAKHVADGLQAIKDRMNIGYMPKWFYNTLVDLIHESQCIQGEFERIIRDHDNRNNIQINNNHLVGKRCREKGGDRKGIGEIIGVNPEMPSRSSVKWPNGSTTWCYTESLVIVDYSVTDVDKELSNILNNLIKSMCRTAEKSSDDVTSDGIYENLKPLEEYVRRGFFPAQDKTDTKTLNELAMEVNEIAISKGWWKGNRNKGELIALMHSELSEALEGIRHGDPPDDHLPQFKSSETEFADCIIRILDYCGAHAIDIDAVIRAKIDYNKTRPYKHGGKEF